MEKRFGLSRAEWALRVLANVWSHLLAQFNDDMTDDQARDVGEAMERIWQAQGDVVDEEESRKAVWRAEELARMAAMTRWECLCGASGWFTPEDRSPAGLDGVARVKHDDMHPRARCKDVDIVRVETREAWLKRRSGI